MNTNQIIKKRINDNQQHVANLYELMNDYMVSYPETYKQTRVDAIERKIALYQSKVVEAQKIYELINS